MKELEPTDNIEIRPSKDSIGVSEWGFKDIHQNCYIVAFYNYGNCTSTIILEDFYDIVEEVEQDKEPRKIAEYDSSIGESVFSITKVDFDIRSKSISDKVECQVCGRDIEQGELIFYAEAIIDGVESVVISIHISCWDELSKLVGDVKKELGSILMERPFHSIYIREYENERIECYDCGEVHDSGVVASINNYTFCIGCLKKLVNKAKSQDVNEFVGRSMRTNSIDYRRKCVICGERNQGKICRVMSHIYMHEKCVGELAELDEDRIDDWIRSDVSLKI